MFNVRTYISLHLVTLLIGINLSSNDTAAKLNEFRNYGNQHSETRRGTKNFLPSNLLEHKINNDEDTQIEVYNVTFTENNGQEIRVIINKTFLLNEVGVDSSFIAKSREDAFIKTSPEDNPYSAIVLGLQDNTVKSLCTGTLLTPQWVLTAAHCSQLDPKSNTMLVYAGGYSLSELWSNNHSKWSQVRKSTEFYTHPDFSIDADISVIKVRPFTMTKAVNIVRLSTQPWTYHDFKECKITGFGIVQFNVQSVDDSTRKTQSLLVIKPCVCSSMLNRIIGPKTSEWYICTKPMDDYGICHGDSGGALICDGQVKGVAVLMLHIRNIEYCAFSLSQRSRIKCGVKDTLTMFQDTCPYLHWINGYVKLFNESEISPECVYTGAIGTTIQSHIFLCILFVIAVFI